MMNIEWPEGAEFYAPEERTYSEGFYKFEGGEWYFMLRGGSKWVRPVSDPHNTGRTLTPRPAAAEWLPGAGVVAQTSCGQCEIIAVDPVREQAAVRYIDTGQLATILFSGLFQPAPSLRDELITVVIRAMGNAYVDGPGGVSILSEPDASFYAAAAVDAVLAEVDVSPK